MTPTCMRRRSAHSPNGNRPPSTFTVACSWFVLHTVSVFWATCAFAGASWRRFEGAGSPQRSETAQSGGRRPPSHGQACGSTPSSLRRTRHDTSATPRSRLCRIEPGGLKPDPLLTVSEWADRYRVLSQRASSEPGRWRTERTPYLRDIMDCLSPSSPTSGWCS